MFQGPTSLEAICSPKSGSVTRTRTSLACSSDSGAGASDLLTSPTTSLTLVIALAWSGFIPLIFLSWMFFSSLRELVGQAVELLADLVADEPQPAQHHQDGEDHREDPGHLEPLELREIGTSAKLSRIARARGLRTSAARYMKAMIAKMKSVMTIGWSIDEVLRCGGHGGVLPVGKREVRTVDNQDSESTGGPGKGSSTPPERLRFPNPESARSGRERDREARDQAFGPSADAEPTGTGIGRSPEPINEPRITAAIEIKTPASEYQAWPAWRLSTVPAWSDARVLDQGR